MQPQEAAAQRTPDPLLPRDVEEVGSAIKAAVAFGTTLEIIGQGSKRGLGRAAQWDRTLDLSGLSGVTLYEPAELVLSARAGTPLREIEELLQSRGQQLAFEPMDYGPLLGQPERGGTIGGALATNLSGPRRIKAGAARDHFLGFTAISGRGETFKSGGRVVKNVTGYDLSKLLAGSWGTLAVMTDVTVKVLPRPETEATLLLLGLDDAAAVQAMSTAMGSQGEVSGAAHLPANAAMRTNAAGARAGKAVTAFRLEGVPPSIAHRRELLQKLFAWRGELALLAEQESRALWRAIRDVTPFAAASTGHERPVWRISVVPMRGAETAQRIASQADGEVMYDWSGGLIWALLPPSEDAGARIVREAVASGGGHATLVRGPGGTRAAVPVFQPQDRGHAALTKRIKGAFDPKGVLNPGRMYAGV